MPDFSFQMTQSSTRKGSPAHATPTLKKQKGRRRSRSRSRGRLARRGTPNRVVRPVPEIVVFFFSI